MNQPSRTARRQSGRGGATPPPKGTDSMRYVYIGIAVLVVGIFAVFGFIHWRESVAIADAWATPTPIPSGVPTSKPIQVYEDQTLGKSVFPEGNTSKGGQGDPVDGVECANGMTEYQALHIHTHLAIFDHGKQIALPKLVGAVVNASKGPNGCLYWIHTHNSSGVIHVEAPVVQNPSTGGPFTLGDFFDIWGQALDADHVATYSGPVTAYVNGVKYDGNLKDIPLMSHQRIVLEVGTPVVPPPNYLLPPND